MAEARPEREAMEFDVVIVGGGPAGLSAAIRLKQLNARNGGLPGGKRRRDRCSYSVRRCHRASRAGTN